MRKAILSAALAALATPAFATPPIMTPPAPAAPPALTLVIAVDGLSSALFDRYRSGFSGGFARLGGGARFSLEGGGELIGGLGQAVKSGRPGSQTVVVAASSALMSATPSLCR